MDIDATTYLQRFEARELGPEYFDHVGHLRMAWLHLNRYDQEEAVARVCTGIRDLATRFGAPEKFNYTVSEALVRIIAARMTAGESFEAFVEANPDLVADSLGVLHRYFSDSLLFSQAARNGWVEPDRAALNG